MFTQNIIRESKYCEFFFEKLSGFLENPVLCVLLEIHLVYSCLNLYREYLGDGLGAINKLIIFVSINRMI